MDAFNGSPLQWEHLVLSITSLLERPLQQTQSKKLLIKTTLSVSGQIRDTAEFVTYHAMRQHQQLDSSHYLPQPTLLDWMQRA